MIQRLARWRGALVAVLLGSLAMVSVQAASPPTKGEVRRVDTNEGRITVKHGPIPALELPAMTLVYRVQDKSLLVVVEPGDTITFTADRIDGQYVILTLSK